MQHTGDAVVGVGRVLGVGLQQQQVRAHNVWVGEPAESNLDISVRGVGPETFIPSIFLATRM